MTIKYTDDIGGPWDDPGGEKTKMEILDRAGYIEEIAHLQDELAKVKEENSEIKKILQDAEAVWVNMLSGTIARPRALDHYEECKQKIEHLEDRMKAMDKVVQDIKNLKNEVNCRREHGANHGGHLDYVETALIKAFEALDRLTQQADKL